MVQIHHSWAFQIIKIQNFLRWSRYSEISGSNPSFLRISDHQNSKISLTMVSIFWRKRLKFSNMGNLRSPKSKNLFNHSEGIFWYRCLYQLFVIELSELNSKPEIFWNNNNKRYGGLQIEQRHIIICWPLRTWWAIHVWGTGLRGKISQAATVSRIHIKMVTNGEGSKLHFPRMTRSFNYPAACPCHLLLFSYFNHFTF